MTRAPWDYSEMQAYVEPKIKTQIKSDHDKQLRP